MDADTKKYIRNLQKRMKVAEQAIEDLWDEIHKMEDHATEEQDETREIANRARRAVERLRKEMNE